MTQEQLLERIEKFRARHSLTKSAFGLLTCNSGNLLTAIEGGRVLREKTLKNIAKRMDGYNADQKDADRAALSAVMRCGFVIIEQDGIPRLESDTQIDAAAFSRLKEDGLLIPSNDAMFGCNSQTYARQGLPMRRSTKRKKSPYPERGTPAGDEYVGNCNGPSCGAERS